MVKLYWQLKNSNNIKQIVVIHIYIVLFTNDSACYTYKNLTSYDLFFQNAIINCILNPMWKTFQVWKRSTVYKNKNKCIQITNFFCLHFFSNLYHKEWLLAPCVDYHHQPKELFLFQLYCIDEQKEAVIIFFNVKQPPTI